jgi:hypothetical protein
VEPVIDSVVKVVLREAPRPEHPLGIVYATHQDSVPRARNMTQYCSFAVLKSGRRVKMYNSWNIPECETLYQAWLQESQV